VLPPETEIYAVGGVGPKDFADWKLAGASGFGLGSSLFQPDWPVERVAAEAAASVAAYDAIYG
jgi:2-dehydro-3-deoxyphosphogalactonate aldolase